ncbi:FAD-dependent oxidoreductase [Pseudomonas sp. WJP1]|uniref:NAD(P)/FAD-dependent oxidoreductase n=1 Tax=Pseudomonas sp. WJP1 TaxID=2986947 RepID=UPI00234974A6|nr:FAD-dependent oxidoreductase [Pseudomonas sp. WJP1]WCM53709.1 FAD-dependent oxidoreductase [Pseudomonas sp. WJP1]
MKPFDAVVIGGGPAGCAAAISCAQRGLRVALLERERFPRFRPGESLHPGIEPLLQQLGVPTFSAQGVVRFSGHWVQWNGPLRFNDFGGDSGGTWQGFHVARATLDTALLQRAATLGVSVLQPCQARRLLTHDRRVIGVETDKGPLLSTYLIDASGAAGWLSRQHRLSVRRCSPLLVARYGYLQGCLEPYEYAPHLLADPDGWTWVANVQDQLLHWTRLCFAEGKSTPHAVPEALRGLPSSGPVLGADVTWRVSTAPAGAGYFMVGDAASLLDPAASHGVLKALMSGMQAAQALFDSLEQPTIQYSAQGQYSQWVSDWFARDLAQMRHFYATHPCPPDWLASWG